PSGSCLGFPDDDGLCHGSRTKGEKGEVYYHSSMCFVTHIIRSPEEDTVSPGTRVPDLCELPWERSRGRKNKCSLLLSIFPVP
ncbi:hypothetical protein STEG23_031966, partial [Scotinomys teguina]